MDIDVRPAAESDLGTVLSVVDETAAWLHSIGITQQWPASFSAQPESVESVRELIHRGAVFLAWQEDQPMASVALEQEPYADPVEVLWPDGASDAVLLGKLAVRRSVAGTGIVLRLLQWAAEYARSRGKLELRLDCWAGNERLKRYYAEAGFESCGDAAVELSGDGEPRVYSVSRFRMRVN